MSGCLRSASLLAASLSLARGAYPVTVENCGVSRTYAAAPTRAITMNQGATEFMLAMGLQDSMVGTAYLDDTIWPKYATAYAQVPVLSATYPNETHIMAQNPDFIVGSYRSAFYGQYTIVRNGENQTRGIFSEETVGPCEGQGSEYGAAWTSCRPQLHSADIGTYLFEDSCENASLRPTTVTEETVYEEMRALGDIFNVDVEPLITEMKSDFDQAAALVTSTFTAGPMKTVWLDCVGRCCQVEEGEEEEVYVGGGTGAPNMLMQEAGLENLFSDRPGSWVCVKVSDIVAAQPEVIVVVDAAWDTAMEKIKWMYNDEEFCQLEVLRAARFVQIPFSATTLSPRNGPAALDLAVAALHVRTGSATTTQQSGVSSFNPYVLQVETACGRCPLNPSFIIYDDASEANFQQLCPTTTGYQANAALSSRGALSVWAFLNALAVFCLLK